MVRARVGLVLAVLLMWYVDREGWFVGVVVSELIVVVFRSLITLLDQK